MIILNGTEEVGFIIIESKYVNENENDQSVHTPENLKLYIHKISP